MTEDSKTCYEYLLRLERGLLALYQGFARLFPGDANLWSALAVEEESHARLLISHEEFILASPAFGNNLLSADLTELVGTTLRVEDAVRGLEERVIGRTEAGELAVDLENGAGERHFHLTMRSTVDDMAVGVLRRLGQYDKGHADMVRHFLATGVLKKTA
jgi:hypothetical protein